MTLREPVSHVKQNIVFWIPLFLGDIYLRSSEVNAPAFLQRELRSKVQGRGHALACTESGHSRGDKKKTDNLLFQVCCNGCKKRAPHIAEAFAVRVATGRRGSNQNTGSTPPTRRLSTCLRSSTGLQQQRCTLSHGQNGLGGGHLLIYANSDVLLIFLVRVEDCRRIAPLRALRRTHARLVQVHVVTSA